MVDGFPVGTRLGVMVGTKVGREGNDPVDPVDCVGEDATDEWKKTK